MNEPTQGDIEFAKEFSSQWPLPANNLYNDESSLFSIEVYEEVITIARVCVDKPVIEIGINKLAQLDVGKEGVLFLILNCMLAYLNPDIYDKVSTLDNYALDICLSIIPIENQDLLKSDLIRIFSVIKRPSPIHAAE